MGLDHASRHVIQDGRGGEYEEHYRHRYVRRFVARCAVSSGPTQDLSGGFDSSSMVCMAEDILTKEGSEYRELNVSVHDSNETRRKMTCPLQQSKRNEEEGVDD